MHADDGGNPELVRSEESTVVGPPDRADEVDATALVAEEGCQRVEQIG